MPTRNIKLTEYDGDFVEGLIASGRYKDASEVMRAGLRLLERQAQEDEEKLRVLQGLATEAFEALDRGEGILVEGDQQLEDFISGVGRRAARSRASVDGGDCPMPQFRISPQAERDIEAVLSWTHEEFGEKARLRYEALLTRAILDVAESPERAGSHDRPEIATAARTYHFVIVATGSRSRRAGSSGLGISSSIEPPGRA